MTSKRIKPDEDEYEVWHRGLGNCPGFNIDFVECRRGRPVAFVEVTTSVMWPMEQNYFEAAMNKRSWQFNMMSKIARNNNIRLILVIRYRMEHFKVIEGFNFKDYDLKGYEEFIRGL